MGRDADRCRILIAYTSDMTRKFLASMALLLAAPALFAAVSVSLAPPYVEKVVRPGAKLQDSITYMNESDTPMMVTVDFADFGVDEAGQVVEMPTGTDQATLARYLRVSPLKVRVEPGGRTIFRYSMTAPESFGQLRTQIFFSSTPIVPGAANQVLFVARMGVPLYVENINAKPASLKVHEVKWERDDARTLILRLQVTNEGERNIRSNGYLQVRSKNGEFAKTFPFNETNEPVLPGQKRDWRIGFGPVPEGELTLDLRFATSPRTMFEEKYQLE
jgi:hypothetical protein